MGQTSLVYNLQEKNILKQQRSKLSNITHSPSSYILWAQKSFKPEVGLEINDNCHCWFNLTGQAFVLSDSKVQGVQGDYLKCPVLSEQLSRTHGSSVFNDIKQKTFAAANAVWSLFTLSDMCINSWFRVRSTKGSLRGQWKSHNVTAATNHVLRNS